MAERSSPACRFVAGCPMFPMFQQQAILRIYQINYCHGDFATCERYKLASRGTMPDPALLPDGDRLEAPSRGRGDAVG